ncbi:MAG: hypothetical protein ACLT90_16045 [Enterococcus raffinosus]
MDFCSLPKVGKDVSFAFRLTKTQAPVARMLTTEISPSRRLLAYKLFDVLS